MPNKPITVIKISKSRDVKYTISTEEHYAIILAYLRKSYANFRGFKDNEIDIDFVDDGSVNCHAYKES